MAAQARLDNAVKSERTKDGMTKRLKAGLPTNKTAVGYKNRSTNIESDEKLPPIRDEPRFSILQEAGYDYSKGIYNKRQIAEILNEKGFKTSKGKPASSQFVSKWLSNTFYKGIIYSKVRDEYFPENTKKCLQKTSGTRYNRYLEVILLLLTQKNVIILIFLLDTLPYVIVVLILQSLPRKGVQSTITITFVRNTDHLYLLKSLRVNSMSYYSL